MVWLALGATACLQHFANAGRSVICGDYQGNQERVFLACRLHSAPWTRVQHAWTPRARPPHLQTPARPLGRLAAWVAGSQPKRVHSPSALRRCTGVPEGYLKQARRVEACVTPVAVCNEGRIKPRSTCLSRTSQSAAYQGACAGGPGPAVRRACSDMFCLTQARLLAVLTSVSSCNAAGCSVPHGLPGL